MIPLPKSRTLPALAADSLREAIANGIWKTVLPSERDLARELGVGRGVIRAALARLQDEGVVQKRPKAKARILAPGRESSRPGDTAIVFLSTYDRRWAYRPFHPAVHGDQYRVVEIAMPRLQEPRAKETLATITGRHPNAIWVLVSQPLPVQRWFGQHHPDRTLILGHRFPGVELPAIDTDTEAACWHAAVQMARQGCRSITLLQSRGKRAGELAAQHGLRRFQGAYPDIRVRIRIAPRHPSGFDALLEPLRVAAGRPAGMILGHPYYAIALVCAALKRGVAIGRDLCLASLFEDSALTLLPGPLLVYTARQVTFHKLDELIRRRLRGTKLMPREWLFVPEAVGSLA